MIKSYREIINCVCVINFGNIDNDTININNYIIIIISCSNFKQYTLNLGRWREREREIKFYSFCFLLVANKDKER